MARLKCKSFRGDLFAGPDLYYEGWSWAPDRDIKVKIIAGTMENTAGMSTVWAWLSRGSVGMKLPDTPNEEEMILWAAHIRAEFAATEAPNLSHVVDFGEDYMEVKEGEKLYVNLRGTGSDAGIGLSLCIYYV
ncbi:hypothetical protein ES705_41538 [subsurface metagenome]